MNFLQVAINSTGVESSVIALRGGVQPNFFGKLDFELVVGPSGTTYEQTFPGVFKVPDPLAPALCHAQISPPKMVISQNWSKPGLWVLYG